MYHRFSEAVSSLYARSHHSGCSPSEHNSAQQFQWHQQRKISREIEPKKKIPKNIIKPSKTDMRLEISQREDNMYLNFEHVLLIHFLLSGSQMER